MNDKTRELLKQNTGLEDEIEETLREQPEQLLEFLHDGIILFRRELDKKHRQLKIGLFGCFFR